VIYAIDCKKLKLSYSINLSLHDIKQDIMTNYREFTEEDLIFVKGGSDSGYTDELNTLFENMTRTLFKTCESAIKKNSRYIIKFIYFCQSYDSQVTQYPYNTIYRCSCIAIDNYGDLVTLDISTKRNSSDEIIPFEPYDVTCDCNEHDIELPVSLINLVLETDWGCGGWVDSDIYHMDSYVDKYVVLFESFLTQLKKLAIELKK